MSGWQTGEVMEYKLAGAECHTGSETEKRMTEAGWEPASDPDPRYGSRWMRRRIYDEEKKDGARQVVSIDGRGQQEARGTGQDGG